MLFTMKDVGNTQVLWVINFKDNKPLVIKNFKARPRFPRIDSFLPGTTSPLATEPIIAGDPETQKKALEFLNEIIEACKEIKEECVDTLEHKKEEKYEEKVSGVTNQLKGLFKLILDLMRILKKNEPPKEDKNDKAA